MSLLSGIFLGLSLWVAIVLGAQTNAWTWGPAMLVLGLSMVAALGARPRGGWGIGLALAAALGWIGFRAWGSPVAELARADAMLALSLAAAAWAAAGVAGSRAARNGFCVVLALAVLTNVAIAGLQWFHPAFSWPYASKPTEAPTGWFGHYNYFSNFNVGAGFLLLAQAVLGRVSTPLRILYGLAFAAAAVGVPLSGSRGGMLALAVGGVLFLLSTAVVLWRRKSRGAPLFLIAVPVLIVVALAIGWTQLQGIQERRSNTDEAVVITDGQGRLQWIDLGWEIAREHPWMGGGSRSYWWKRAEHWNHSEEGRGAADEPFVHNEPIQLLAEYGWIGVLLVVLVLGAMLWRVMRGIFMGAAVEREEDGDVDARWVGALAAGAGMLAQSNLSFVFHLLPSVLLLGCLIGLVVGSGGADEPGPGRRWGQRLVGVALLLPLLFWGGRASLAFQQVWPVLHGRAGLGRSDPMAAVERLQRAQSWWPGFRLKEEEGHLCQWRAGTEGLPEEIRAEWIARGAEAYQQASEAYPFHAGIYLNLARLRALQGRDEEAEQAYERGVVAQGGLEPAFRARLRYAQYLYDSWYRRWTRERRASEALAGFRKARELIAKDGGGLYRKLDEEIRKSVEFLEGAGVR